MTDAKQTKCPHCGSTFRITDAQLAAKGGSVRCGSCLQVFRADLHLVGAAAPAPAAARPAAPAPAAAPAAKGKPAKGDESWALGLIGEEGGKAAGDDDFGFSDDDISAFIAKGAAAPEASAPGKSVLFDDELSDALEEAGGGFGGDLGGDGDIHRLSESADESWAKDILDELESEKKAPADQYGMELVDDKAKAGPKNPKLAAAVGMRPAPGAEAPAAPPRPAPRPAAPADDLLGEDADVLSFLDNDDLSQPAGTAAPAPGPAFLPERPLAHVDAPVTLKPQRPPVRWGYVLGWTFMCLFALALLATQYIIFNFDKLAANPVLRPTLESTCARLGCYVPDIPDPARLKVDELVVRKHPSVEGALVVDAILKNHADFPQPFPVLRLRFSNSAEEVVASRLLKPAEYLQGEARVMRRMPPDTPFRISLEVVDPGKEAISYGLDPIL